MKAYQHILIEDKQYVRTIWLNRPEKHNAFNPLLIHELQEAFVLCAKDQDIRVVLLRGSGKSFCAGADLEYMHDISRFGIDENKADALKLASLFESVYLCPKPVIAVVHGSVYGGANGLAAASDIVLADEDTKFAFTEVKLGITPATISPYVIARSGRAAASELMLTGRRFTAKEAYRYMLVNELFTSETLQTQLDYYIGNLMYAGPQAVTACKALIHEVASMSLDNPQLKEYTSRQIAQQRATAEAKEGIQAFFEKRNPKWTQP